jgi:H+-translocating NAD(P) transhydrogenase subunit beta
VTAESVVQTTFIIAALLFILALAGLSRHESARLGNLAGMVGMTLAGAATVGYALTHSQRGLPLTVVLLVVPLLIGSAIGLWLALRVQMTGMPQLIAMLHSFVGLAAVLVGFSSFLDTAAATGGSETAHLVEVGVGVLIGAYTFTGSVVAYGKLSGRLSGRPLMLPGRTWLNLAAFLASIAAIVWLVGATHGHGLWPLGLVTLLGFALGWHMVSSIGGGDMPVVVSMRRPLPGSCWAMTCSSSPGPWWGHPVRS